MWVGGWVGRIMGLQPWLRLRFGPDPAMEKYLSVLIDKHDLCKC